LYRRSRCNGHPRSPPLSKDLRTRKHESAAASEANSSLVAKGISTARPMIESHYGVYRGLTAAFQPRRPMKVPEADGCKRWILIQASPCSY
jgi:hypothetical protein